MKIKSYLWLLFLAALFASPNIFSQTPPPNDNLTNATVLTGTDITFTGSVSNATLETNELQAAFGTNLVNMHDPPPPTASVWWSWTAPVSTVLNLEMEFLNLHSIDNYVCIYSVTNGTTNPAGFSQPPLTNFVIQNGIPNFLISVPVVAGSNYLVQLIGITPYSYTFHLIATNTPFIFRQPVGRTVSSNKSTIFYVESGGLSPQTFQWRLNGTNIPSENAPILALNHIDSSMAGNYSVLVTIPSGSILSDAALLAVSQSNVPPVLTSLGRRGNVLAFNLTGELGRAYRIETSSNLIDWVEANNFPFRPLDQSVSYYGLGSVVYTTNLSLHVEVENDSAQAYYRASIYKTDDDDSEVCINNLRQIVVAKRLWRHTSIDLYPSATPSWADMQGFFPHFDKMYCPDNPYLDIRTSYEINNLLAVPVCDIHSRSHILEAMP